MNTTGIETQYPNYAASGTSKKSSRTESRSGSFQNEIENWAKRIKEAIDKEQEEDRKGSIQMSEKQWRNLMKKVDNAIDTLQASNKEREQEEKKQSQETNLVRKDTVAASVQTHKAQIL